MEACEIRVLLVEDNAAEARLLQETLSESVNCYVFDHVIRLDKAVERLTRSAYQLVLLDVNLPDATGLEGLNTINDLGMPVPVVVLTGVNDERLAIEAMRAGAQDYLVKGEQHSTTLARTLRYAVERHRLSLAGLSAEPAGDSAHVAGAPAPSRQVFHTWLASAIRDSERSGQSLALLLVCLERLRTIIDALGPQCGETLLRTAGQRLGALVSGRGKVARLGGSDFGLILPEASSHIAAAEVAREIIQTLSRPYAINGGELHVGASLGLVVQVPFGQDAGQLLRQADLAMQSAKEAGGNTYQFYSPHLHEAAAHHLTLESNLRVALERQELTLHFQPCIDLVSGRVVSMEALSRWQQPELGLVLPGDFIPVAEASGLVIKLDAWALRAACAQGVLWHRAGFEGIRTAVNLSARHFAHGGIAALVEKVIRETGMRPCDVELELTETALMHKPQEAARTLERLKAMGVMIAVDDFGIGYSSLSYLRNLPVDILKIDRSFVHNLPHDTKDAAVVASIVSLAKSLGLTVIAEGVETPAQLQWLRSHGCDRVQGFLISPPVPSPDIAELNEIYRNKRLDARIA